MKKFFSLGISLMLFSFITSSLYASTPLVDAVWVKYQIGKKGMVMLDLRMPASYKKGHVPGAVYTNYSKDGWRVKNSEGITACFRQWNKSAIRSAVWESAIRITWS